MTIVDGKIVNTCLHLKLKIYRHDGSVKYSSDKKDFRWCVNCGQIVCIVEVKK